MSPKAFNQASQIPIVLPITNSGEFAKRLRFAVAISGIKIEGVVRCDKPRALDLSARKARKFDKLPDHLGNKVLPQVVTMFE